MKKPNFFIVGASRSGTTSLWHYLKSHPMVFMPQDELVKEPCFFSTYGESQGREYYENLFANANEDHVMVGEASTVYLSDPLSAQRIYDYNPDSKIIIILRNPVHRAFSLYSWMTQEGYEYACSFESALELENQRLQLKNRDWYHPAYLSNYHYFHSGLYAKQVKRYIDLFGDKVLLLVLEDFQSNPVKECQRLCDFLNVTFILPENKKQNSSHSIYSPIIQFLLRKLTLEFICQKQAKHDSFDLSLYFAKCLHQLSLVTHIPLIDRFRIKIIQTKINSRLPYLHDIITIASTKAERDVLLHFGMKKNKSPQVSMETAIKLKKSYKYDISELSIITGISFTKWER